MVLGIYVFYVSACVGSFLNVVVYRLKTGENFISGRSQCPVCSHQIALYDNLPVFSYLLLRAKCRHCKAHIPLRYFFAEVAMGFAGLSLYLCVAGQTWLIAAAAASLASAGAFASKIALPEE